MMASASRKDSLDFEDVEMEEDLGDVTVDVGDLMPPEKTKLEIPKTFEFGKSSTTSEDLDRYSVLGWFARTMAKGDTYPEPRPNEAIVFRDFFLLEFRVPTARFVGTQMERYETQLHHRTPNSLINISKFIWVFRTFGAELDVDCFAKYYELHNLRPERVTFDGEVKDAQYGRCTFIPCRAIGKGERIHLSFTQRNIWDDD